MLKHSLYGIVLVVEFRSAPRNFRGQGRFSEKWRNLGIKAIACKNLKYLSSVFGIKTLLTELIIKTCHLGEEVHARKSTLPKGACIRAMVQGLFE